MIPNETINTFSIKEVLNDNNLKIEIFEFSFKLRVPYKNVLELNCSKFYNMKNSVWTCQI